MSRYGYPLWGHRKDIHPTESLGAGFPIAFRILNPSVGGPTDGGAVVGDASTQISDQANRIDMVVVHPGILWMPKTMVKGEEFIRDLIPWCSIFIEEGNPVQSEANGAVGGISFSGYIVRTDRHFHDTELFRYLVVSGWPWST